MNIDPKSIISGMRSMEAREVMRQLHRVDFRAFPADFFAARFGVSQQTAMTRIETFEADGYFEKSADKNKHACWKLTIKGTALAQASAAKKVKRATADKHYQAFLQRVQEINKADYYLYRVTKVVLFGSYLNATEAVSDIDLFIWIERKPEFESNCSEIREQRTTQMVLEGRHFRSFGEQLNWPELDVRKYLKNGSRVISIQADNIEHEWFEHKVVFEITPNEHDQPHHA